MHDQDQDQDQEINDQRKGPSLALAMASRRSSKPCYDVDCAYRTEHSTVEWYDKGTRSLGHIYQHDTSTWPGPDKKNLYFPSSFLPNMIRSG